jgi:glycosyltransferase involved in cell wall biosynthesis
MSRRRLLLIAFHYPPIQGSSGVHRSLAFSKFLPEFGWDVTVLTVVARAHERTRAENLGLIPPAVQVIRAQAWDAARHFAIKGRYPSALAAPDRWSSWIPFATFAGARAARTQRFDAIFSTFPIASAHIIGRNLHRRTGLPWLADFRDPMATTTYPHEQSLRERWKGIQDSVVREAKRIVVTTPGAAAFYQRMYPDAPREQTVVIENGFDPDAFPVSDARATPAAGGVLTLLHSGILYPRERDPKPFFRALKRLRERGVAAKGAVRVVFRASGFEDQYMNMIREHGLEDTVSLAPALPYTEALEEMRAASALLLFQANNCNEQIPAKAYEYLYAGRPILGLTDPRGDTGRLLGRFGVPGIAALEDEDGIVQMLESALPNIRQNSYNMPSREAVMSVSRRAGTQQLAELLNQVVSGGPVPAA